MKGKQQVAILNREDGVGLVELTFEHGLQEG